MCVCEGVGGDGGGVCLIVSLLSALNKGAKSFYLYCYGLQSSSNVKLFKNFTNR